jgi:ABC-type anion transport system duplicated permease subunit
VLACHLVCTRTGECSGAASRRPRVPRARKERRRTRAVWHARGCWLLAAGALLRVVVVAVAVAVVVQVLSTEWSRPREDHVCTSTHPLISSHLVPSHRLAAY